MDTPGAATPVFLHSYRALQRPFSCKRPESRGKEDNMQVQEIPIKELLRINILLERGDCKNFREALKYNGNNALVKMMVGEAIGSFARSLNIDGKIDLYMGTSYVPYEKQSALRILKRDCTPDDVVKAIGCIYMIELAEDFIYAVELAEGYGVDYMDYIPNVVRKLNEDDVRRIFRYLEPMFTVLKMSEITEEAVVSEFQAANM